MPNKSFSIGRAYEHHTGKGLAILQFVSNDKKRFGQRTQGETTNTRKRAAARIALTCLVGHWRQAGVRIFYENCSIDILPMRDTGWVSV
jgi:hypothetical protein